MNQTLQPNQVDYAIHLLKYWSTLIPAVQTLIIMIGLDILSGWLVAAARKKLNSSTSFAGMCKKAMILILVSVGMLIEPYANGIPLSMLIAIGFICMEALSIMENAAALGIWVPPILKEVLEKLQQDRQNKMLQRTGLGDKLDRNSEALERRVTQSDNVMPVRIVEPVKAEVVNDSKHPVPVASSLDQPSV